MSATVQSIDELAENFDCSAIGNRAVSLISVKNCRRSMRRINARKTACTPSGAGVAEFAGADGRITIADSDAFIVKGLISVFGGLLQQNAEQFLIDGEAELGRLDLLRTQVLQEGRFAMVQRVRELAAAQEASP